MEEKWRKGMYVYVPLSARLKKEKNGASPAGEAKAPPPPPSVSERTAVVVADVTVEDGDALDCGVCFLPLKPPIFQCEVGHVVCSPCRDRLQITAPGKCHLCGVATGYRRCHAMERLVESIRVPCPNAAHGCAARPAYHDRETHSLACPHAPCRCPGEACVFFGSTEALLDHFAGVHRWPCTKDVRAGDSVQLLLLDGFNFIDVDRGRRLLLVNVARGPHSTSISVFHFHIVPRTAAAAADGQGSSLSNSKEVIECELTFKRCVYASSRRPGDQLTDHYQKCKFRVECTDLSNGLPSCLDDCFQFVVPNCALGEENKYAIQVTARLFICY